MATPRTTQTNCAVGDRIRLTQQIPFGTRCLTTTIEGRVERMHQAKTGAWYAHARDGRLWVDRILIRQDDGSLTDCILDPYSHTEMVRPAQVGNL